MIAMNKFGFKSLLAAAFLLSAFSQTASAGIEVSGVRFDDTVKVAGTDLKLNGAGMRTKMIFKVYAAGLYLPKKESSVPDIMKMDGPRRITLVMVRDVSSDDFGQAFMTGMSNNSTAAEKSKILNQTMKFGEMFASLPGVKKGDVLHLDWIPGTGTVVELNGKMVGSALPDVEFYNAVMRIWIGDRPADRSLKPALLGEAR